MNRIMKGAIALGAATVLLIGGAGSLAYWQSTQTIDGDTFDFFASGFEVTPGTASWTRNGTPITQQDLEAQALIPGTTLVYTAPFSVSTNSLNFYLTAEAALGEMIVSPVGAPTWPTRDFSDAISATSIITGTGVTATTTPGVYNLSGATNLSLVMTISWPYGTTPEGKETMMAGIDFADTTVTITQVPAPLPDPCAC